jgi:hypothetical protein
VEDSSRQRRVAHTSGRQAPGDTGLNFGEPIAGTIIVSSTVPSMGCTNGQGKLQDSANAGLTRGDLAVFVL